MVPRRKAESPLRKDVKRPRDEVTKSAGPITRSMAKSPAITPVVLRRSARVEQKRAENTLSSLTSSIAKKPLPSPVPYPNRNVRSKHRRTEGKKASRMPNLEQAPNPSRLLALPAELRISIYEFALRAGNAEGRTPVTSDFRPSGLRSTNRQIRAETHKIWRKVNKFYFKIPDCDSSLMRKFGTSFLPRSTLWHLEGTENWGNLMQ